MELINYRRGKVYVAHGLGGFGLWSVGSIALGLVTKWYIMVGSFSLPGRWEVKERLGWVQGPNSHFKGTPQ